MTTFIRFLLLNTVWIIFVIAFGAAGWSAFHHWQFYFWFILVIIAVRLRDYAFYLIHEGKM